jgi:hypothetical protein
VHTRLAYRRGDRKFDHYDEETFFGEEGFPEGEPVTGAVLEEQRLFDWPPAPGTASTSWPASSRGNGYRWG